MAMARMKVEAFFTPGTLAEKAQDAAALRARGDAMLFDGAVDWAVFLPQFDKRLRGHNESLDSAMADIASLLNMLLSDHEAHSEVACSLEVAA